MKKQQKQTKEKDLLKIGTHLSVAAGYRRMGQDALAIGANTLQFFARNPRGARAKEINPEDIGGFRKLLEENGFARIIAHAPYTLNPCSPQSHLRTLSAQMFAEDLQRMELLPGNLYNLHPGSRLEQDEELAISQIAEMLNKVMFPNMHTTVLLETMSGKGSEVGKSFEELKEILKRVELEDKIGICMDACHMWNAGYDIVDKLDEVLEQFDHIIGLKYLKAIHINNSKDSLGSGKDRHEQIGQGYIGEAAIIRMIKHPLLQGLPFILETPTDLDGHREEIRRLKEAYHG